MKKKGSAFILTIVIIALLTVMAVSVIRVTASTSITNARFDDSYNLKLTSQSGVIKAYSQLKLDYEKFGVDDKKKGSDVGFVDLNFTTSDGKYDCVINVYNYDKKNESDATLSKERYTIEATATTKDGKHSNTVVAYCPKFHETVVNGGGGNFFKTLTDNALSLISNPSQEAVTVNGAKKHTFLEVEADTPSYVQGKISPHANAINVTENLTGNIAMPAITSSKAKRQDNSEIEMNTWGKLGNDAAHSKIYVYKATTDDTMDTIMLSAPGTDKDAFLWITAN